MAAFLAFSVKELHPKFAAKIGGLGLRNPLAAKTVAQLVAAADAYDALSEKDKAKLEGLLAGDWVMHSRAQVGLVSFTDEQRRARAPVRHPIVREHRDRNAGAADEQRKPTVHEQDHDLIHELARPDEPRDACAAFAEQLRDRKTASGCFARRSPSRSAPKRYGRNGHVSLR
jgi:hypothetical protein